MHLSMLLLLLPLAECQVPHGQTKAPGPPLSPQDAIKAMTVPPGFSVELVAAEPDIVNPVAMHIDEKGRFWITESVEYPKKQAGPGKDRVKVIEIGDDGKAKKITTVIEGLNIPSGIAVGHGGVWLANAPDILYYPIEDFDKLKLGKPQVVVTGFGRADTHELPNSLTWGPDGWLYGLNGVFNPSHIKQGDKEWKFTCALFRIHPRTKQFDIFCEGTSNPWGLAFNDNGDAFVSACVIDHLWHLTQTGYYIRQGGAYPPFASKIGSIVKHKHQKAAYCGLCWFDSDAYPEEYRKKLYMGNIHGNCINCDELHKDGSTYAAKPRPDFLSANDAWFMPVAQKVGPDGCMYILDWYDRYHCYQDANRDPKGIDRLHGRLYRVRYKDTPRGKTADFRTSLTGPMVELLLSSNVFDREHARRRLIERGSWEALDKRGNREYNVDLFSEDKLPVSYRLRFLGVLAGDGAAAILDQEKLLADKEALVRAWTIRATLMQKAPIKESFRRSIAALASDPSPDVQLQVAVASRKLGLDPLPILLEVLNSCGNDKLIPHIVWQNLHPLLEERGDEFLKLVEKLDPEKSANVMAMMPKVVDRVLASKKKDPQTLVSLVTVLAQSQNSRESAAKVLALLSSKVQSGELAGEPFKELQPRLTPVVKKLQNGSNLALALEATFLGASFKDEESLRAVREIAKSPKHPEPVRTKAIESLIGAGDPVALETAGALLIDKSATAVFRGSVLAALAKLDHDKVATLTLERYKDLEPELQPRAIELLTQRTSWSLQLIGDIETKKIPASVVNLNQVRKLHTHKHAELSKRATAIWGTIREGRNPEREQVVAQMRTLIKKTPGDPLKGIPVFNKICAQCHKLHGQGAEVGPDITGNGRADFEQLLSNVFDPSLVIGVGYRQTNVVTKRGQVVNGLIVEDGPQRIVLKTQGGKVETIARTDVDQVTVSNLSYMPEGLERQMSPQEIADLFALLTLDRPPSDPAARKIPGTPR